MRKRKGNGHGLNKVVPLSMAVALLSANTLAAGAASDDYQYAKPDGKTLVKGSSLLNEGIAAVLTGQDVLVRTAGGEFVNLGELGVTTSVDVTKTTSVPAAALVPNAEDFWNDKGVY